MKSRLISAVLNKPDSISAKGFLRDLAVALALTEEDRNTCLNMLPSIYLAQGDAEKEPLLERLAIDCQADREKLQTVIGVMGFFLAITMNNEFPESDWEFWASDLEELEHLNGSTRPVFETMIGSIRSELATEVEPESRRRWTAAGVLPTFEGCGATVEVRSVKKHIYRRGIPIEQYEPEIVDTTTVASISIKVDEGPFKDIYFQVDEDDVEYLVNMFQSVKKEMVAFRRFLKLED